LVGASLLAMAGSNDQKAEHLPPLVAGERLFALALEEGSRHQPYRIATKAEKQGSGYTLNGQKVFVLDGHVADVLIVAARTPGRATIATASRCSWCRETRQASPARAPS
jgi:acyl-CoA dehydrogenase